MGRRGVGWFRCIYRARYPRNAFPWTRTIPETIPWTALYVRLYTQGMCGGPFSRLGLALLCTSYYYYPAEPRFTLVLATQLGSGRVEVEPLCVLRRMPNRVEVVK